MKENQQETTLQAFRQEIDNIDNQIISLLERRMEIVSQVGELKKNNKEKFFIKSSREADMIKELVKNSNRAFPKAAIISIWRKIITAANMKEQPLSIALHNPKNISDYEYLVKEYYNNDVPLLTFDSATNIVAAMEKGEAQIGIFALPREMEESRKEDFNENWWISLANNRLGLKVFAKIPFAEFADKEKAKGKDYDAIHLVAVANKAAEKSSSDNSLLYVELHTEFSKSQLLSALKEQGINARVLKSAKLPQVDGMVFYLIEAEGFFDENDAAIKNLKKAEIRPYAKVLGNFATPIKL